MNLNIIFVIIIIIVIVSQIITLYYVQTLIYDKIQQVNQLNEKIQNSDLETQEYQNLIINQMNLNIPAVEGKFLEKFQNITQLSGKVEREKLLQYASQKDQASAYIIEQKQLFEYIQQYCYQQPDIIIGQIIIVPKNHQMLQGSQINYGQILYNNVLYRVLDGSNVNIYPHNQVNVADSYSYSNKNYIWQQFTNQAGKSFMCCASDSSSPRLDNYLAAKKYYDPLKLPTISRAPEGKVYASAVKGNVNGYVYLLCEDLVPFNMTQQQYIQQKLYIK